MPSSRKPEPKVAATGAAGAFATVLVFALAQFGVEMTAEVAVALTSLLLFAAGYFKA